MVTRIINALKEEEGATMVEYALMLALIAIICIVAVALVGTRARDKFGNSANNLL
ncbi:MAG: Flp family type IVb pilin [Armatimonadota bacterium]|nr:Flp family type IVb pilin [Armatimonadota bacterium]